MARTYSQVKRQWIFVPHSAAGGNVISPLINFVNAQLVTDKYIKDAFGATNDIYLGVINGYNAETRFVKLAMHERQTLGDPNKNFNIGFIGLKRTATGGWDFAEKFEYKYLTTDTGRIVIEPPEGDDSLHQWTNPTEIGSVVMYMYFGNNPETDRLSTSSGMFSVALDYEVPTA